MAAAEPRLGPLVHRSVHHGAALWLVGALQFVLAMAIVQLFWTGHPAYSLTNNVISDLGNTQCGPWPHATSHDVCSPWHEVFDVSIVVLGALVVLGAVLARTGFPIRRSSSVGLWMIALAGVGSIGVGVAPENVNLTVHAASATLAFVVGNLGLLVLGVAMFRDTRWSGLRAYTLFSGLVGLVAAVLFLRGITGAVGTGGMERLIVDPLLLWLIVAPVRLLGIPQYAPRSVPAPGTR